MLPVMQTYIYTEETRVQRKENLSFCSSQNRRMIELILAAIQRQTNAIQYSLFRNIKRKIVSYEMLSATHRYSYT